MGLAVKEVVSSEYQSHAEKRAAWIGTLSSSPPCTASPRVYELPKHCVDYNRIIYMDYNIYMGL